MAVLTTGQSFADGDQVTAQKLEDIASQATFRTGANNTAIGHASLSNLTDPTILILSLSIPRLTNLS